MSRQARQRRRRHHRAGPTRFLLIGGGVLVCALVVGAIAAVGYVLNVAQSAPAIGSLRPIIGGGSSQVFAADGSRLGFIQSDQLRTPVSWSQIPTSLKNATVAIEDQRFYKNNGVDLTGIFRAAIKDITHGQALQGGSTITMQLVRNLYLGGDQHTLKQKIVEAKLAIEYNKRHSKREILTSYLNSVPYGTLGGQTAIGVQAASRQFFDKPASQLDLQESALLAGLPQAPSQYNPFAAPKEAKRRRNEVLAKMAELRYISASEARAAEAAPLEIKRGYFYAQRKEDFFFEYVHQQLVKRYGAQTVAQGGLKVSTTIDLHMQALARKAIAGVLNQPEDPASAIVTINPANGDIEAMAESQSYEESQYNLASQGHRQPGSTFKAIVLADALSRGVDPNSTYYLSHTLSAGWLQGYPTYEVKTFEGTSLNKSINLLNATLTSDNTVYAQLAADLGESTVTEMARKMGVVSPLHSYAAEALGGLTLGVTPLEMANVYATLADGGYRNTPIAITKVVFPDGHVDNNWGQPHRVKVLSEAVAAEETSILKQNVESGTATRSAISCPTAAKTGTTSELVDAWLDGYTPNYSTVVWMGYPNRRVSMTDVHGEPQQGGYLPAEIWHAYMSAVEEGKTCVPFKSANEPISYTPFYGKFATTGQSRSSFEEGSEERHEHPTHPQAKEHGRGGVGAPTPAEPKQEAPASPGNGNGNGRGNGGGGNGGGNGTGGGNGGAGTGGAGPG
ncbi:MAG TPA: transglycosylase domain-containing protein [Solirubrobacteraceae bacterium]|jgi:penicillin-binding protein 1A|nr:transglycosylase domain-containing protein [Solirubrobacteraceae bacterium]